MHISPINYVKELYGNDEKNIQERLYNPIYQGTVRGVPVGVGDFTTPTHYELKTRPIKYDKDNKNRGMCTVTVLQSKEYDIMKLINSNRGATFQVASQFNCLEMENEYVTPAEGIT